MEKVKEVKKRAEVETEALGRSTISITEGLLTAVNVRERTYI